MAPPSAPRRRTTARARRGLGGLYDSLNAEFFQGRLPRWDVRYAPAMLTRRELVGLCDRHRRTIFVARHDTPRRLRQTLLHEMCHVAGPAGHGKGFQRKLARLAAQGERWAERERRRFADVPQQFRRAARAVVESAPWLTWPHALEVMALMTGVPPRELRRCVPDGRREWFALWMNRVVHEATPQQRARFRRAVRQKADWRFDRFVELITPMVPERWDQALESARRPVIRLRLP